MLIGADSYRVILLGVGGIETRWVLTAIENVMETLEENFPLSSFFFNLNVTYATPGMHLSMITFSLDYPDKVNEWPGEGRG